MKKEKTLEEAYDSMGEDTRQKYPRTLSATNEEQMNGLFFDTIIPAIHEDLAFDVGDDEGDTEFEILCLEDLQQLIEGRIRELRDGPVQEEESPESWEDDPQEVNQYQDELARRYN